MSSHRHADTCEGGLGANAGFQDSADLLSKLQDSSFGHRKEQAQAYQSTMLERARPMVEMSAGGAGRFFDMKPLNQLKPADLWH